MMVRRKNMRIDIHVHSKYSKRPSEWILQKIGCPESFTEPLKLYQIAKSRGMSHVTISDHNNIEGALEIAHLPDTFISEEITTYFPDEGCKVHVLALNISEAQHREIQKIRENIYDLARYLKGNKILSIVAHPLYAVNDKLTTTHFEKMLLLFQNFELNGSRNARENECLQHVINRLSEKSMETLAETHGITPLYPDSWLKRLWGGSDDHSALNIARTYTSIRGMEDPGLFTNGMRGADLSVVSRPATPLTLAHNLYSIAYQYYCDKFNLDRYSDKDILMRFLDSSLRGGGKTHPGLLSRLYVLWHSRREKKVQTGVSDSLMDLLRHETCLLIQDDPEFHERPKDVIDFDLQEQRWYDFVNRASKRVMLHFADHLLDHLSGADFFNIFSTLGSAGGLYTLLAPYFVSFSQFSKDRALSGSVKEHFNIPSFQSGKKAFKFAHFTDTFYEVNGVAKTLQQQLHYALKNNQAYTLITCHDSENTDHLGIRNFRPIGTYELPEYPEQKIFYPPFLDMLAYCYDKQIDHIHAATPGPVGLSALAIAKILKLPISGTYHTAIPQYAQILTGDEAIEDLAWKYVLWYYGQLDVIYAPSQSTRDELISRGLHPDKIKLYPRGIDVDFFNPVKRNGIFKKTYQLPEGTKLLYVGRVSREKNLNLLGEVFRRLIQREEKVQLVVVGDGPYLEEMKKGMEGLPCCFTGYLKGESLAEVYASADLFVFPSTTDTFGNVVLEAQASGLPVVVSDLGGPCENIIEERTGLICRADDAESLMAAVVTLVHDPDRRRHMGREARRFVEERSFENAFLKMWKLFQKPVPVSPII
jgi:glycosyltransferase involved in cell wall biosynthesis